MSKTVDEYLRLINMPKRRGRKVSVTTLRSRLADAQKRRQTERGVGRVLAEQQARDLTAQINRLAAEGNGVSIKDAEAAFVKVAPRFSKARNISYGAWRDAGVSAAVLKKAGINR